MSDNWFAESVDRTQRIVEAFGRMIDQLQDFENRISALEAAAKQKNQEREAKNFERARERRKRSIKATARRAKAGPKVGCV